MRATSARRRAGSQQQRSERQQLLLDTVEKLLADRSFRDLTVEDVMREADLPRTTFYRLFPDLEAILLLGVSQIAAELGSASELWFETGTDPAGALRPAGVALVTVYRRHGRLLLAFSEAAATTPTVELAWQQAIEGFVARTAKRIDELKRSGASDIAHSREIARALVWMTERYLLETYGRGTGIPTRTAVDTLERIWQRTLFT